MTDVDSDLDAWHDVQAVAFRASAVRERATHRCAANVPPCPECQDAEEAEDKREFAGQ